MTTAFQPNSAPQFLWATASAVISASTLPFDDDHDVTVEIVARALGKLDADELADFDAQDASQAIATEIVYAALELEASGDDDSATVKARANTSAPMLPPINSPDTSKPDPNANPMSAMLTMIKKVVLPLAEHMAVQEAKIIEISARLSRLEADNSRL